MSSPSTSTSPSLKKGGAGKSTKLMTLRNFTDLAELMKDGGNLTEAEELYRAGLEGRERILGKDHPETLNCMHDLSLVLEVKRKFRDAEFMFRDTLAAKEKVLGRSDPSTCQTAFSLADMLRKLNRHQEAIVLFSYAHTGYTQTYGARHRNSILAEKRLEIVVKEQKAKCGCTVQ
jgi:hypothetical protein